MRVLNSLFYAALIWTCSSSLGLAEGTLLYDFETDADLEAWTNLSLANAQEPAVKTALSKEHVTHGQHCLQLTYSGGNWPAVIARAVPGDWLAAESFQADVTVDRPCVIGFTAMQEKSTRERGWDGGISRWTKTQFLKPGQNTVRGPLHHSNRYSIDEKYGKLVSLEVVLYAPADGQKLYLDNIRLSSEKIPPQISETKFKVLGTDLEVADVQELGKRLAAQWKRPRSKSLDEIEADFRRQYETLKAQHPGCVLAIFRDGQAGYDPAHPTQVYAGWQDAYWSSHGPDSLTLDRAENRGRAALHEVFMRHRSPLMRIDLSSIPQGATIHSAQLVLVSEGKVLDDHDALAKPTMWVAEPCNRPWNETEVNAYRYAKDRYWREIGGRYYGDDPDFLPLYLAHGPGQGSVSQWDFTQAVRFWTSGEHENHGFMLHGDSHDYRRAYTREAEEIPIRPALLVIYEKK